MKELPRFDPADSAPTRYLFFTGKGGVGKTSLACATAVRFADDGKRVLLVSTDPASNLDQVLGVSLSGRPTPVPGAPGLEALNINPEEAAERYRERLIGPMRGVLPEAALANMQEQLSGSCTTEIAAFDEFTALIGQPEAAARIRSCDFRHGANRPHPAAYEPVESLEPVSGIEHQRHLLPRTAGRTGETEGNL